MGMRYTKNIISLNYYYPLMKKISAYISYCGMMAILFFAIMSSEWEDHDNWISFLQYCSTSKFKSDEEDIDDAFYGGYSPKIPRIDYAL